MNYIWDIVLRAKESGLAKEELFFWQAEQSSPYYEQSFPAINQQTVDRRMIEINVLHRFSHIFQELLHPDILQAPAYVRLLGFILYLYDVIVHFLSEIDLRHGLNRREFYVRKIRRELLGGAFGKVAAIGALAMEQSLQLRIANEILTQMQTGSNLRGFRRALLTVFPGSLLYQSNFDSSQLLLYLGREESSDKEKQLAFLLEGFLPFGFHIRVFWQQHFGILGVDATMAPGEIAIF